MTVGESITIGDRLEWFFYSLTYYEWIAVLIVILLLAIYLKK